MTSPTTTAINPEYGDLEIFKKVLDGAHERGMRVIMDLVVNHTSTEHEWFTSSAATRTTRITTITSGARPGAAATAAGRMPNNWDSFFGGDAWEFDEQVGEYYLHVFARQQPDLNHDNPAVRREIVDIMRYWLDLGVDGFREDAIVYISKTPGLPDQYPRCRPPTARRSSPRARICTIICDFTATACRTTTA